MSSGLLKINVKSNFDDVKQMLRGYPAKQIPFATSLALNRTAHTVSGLLSNKIATVFDRPTRWVQGSVRYTKATKKSLHAIVDLDRWGNKQGVSVSQVLKAEIFGGKRHLKRFERALIAMGVMRSNQSAVPGNAATMDQYGNMSSGQINQILSWFHAFGEQGYKANMGAKGKARLARGSKRKGTLGFEYFSIQTKVGKLLPGVYMRKFYGDAGQSRVAHLSHGGAHLVLLFVNRRPTYQIKFDFYGYGEDRAYDEFHKEFPRALEEAKASAR